MFRVRIFLIVAALIIGMGAFLIVPRRAAAQSIHRIDFVGGNTISYSLTTTAFVQTNSQSVVSGILTTPTTTQNPCGTAPRDAYVSVSFDVNPSWNITAIRARTRMDWGFSHSGGWSGLKTYDGVSWADISGFFSPANDWHEGSIAVSQTGLETIEFWFGTCWGAPTLKASLEWLEIDYTLSSTPTPTPTQMPTPSTTLSPGGLFLDFPTPACAIIPQDMSVFRAGSGWSPSQSTGSIEYQTPNSALIAPGAFMAALVSPSAIRYKIILIYRLAQAADDHLLEVSASGSQFIVQATNVTARQRFESPEFSPSQDDGKYVVTILSKSTNTSPIYLDFFCLVPTESDITKNTEYDPDSCFSCDEYIFIDSIICKIRQMIECFLAFILRRIFEFVSGLMVLGVGSGKMFIDGVGGAVGVGVDVGIQTARLGASAVNNVGIQTSNALSSNIIGSSLNSISSGIRDLPTALLNIMGTIFSDSTKAIQSGNLIEISLGFLGIFGRALFDFIGLIPIILQSLIEGFNSAGTPISESITCSNPNILFFYPCLGFYILDNTIFQGPAFLLIPAIMGIMAFDTFIWIAGKVRGSFS